MTLGKRQENEIEGLDLAVSPLDLHPERREGLETGFDHQWPMI